MAQTEIARRARRRVSIRYTEKPDDYDRYTHFKTLSLLAKSGVWAHDWQRYNDPNPEEFEPQMEETTIPTIVANGQELVLEEYLTGTSEKIFHFLIDNGVEGVDLVLATKKEQVAKRHAGGSISHFYVQWSDIGNPDYEDGYSLSIKLPHPENDDEYDFAVIRLTDAKTTDGLFHIDITGPAWVLDTEEVEDAIGFVSHKIDGAYRPRGWRAPEFGCSVDLHYSRTEACDVGWLAKQMPEGAHNTFGDEEE